MRNPKVTVLMPVYDGARYLKQAINSILAQTYTNFELLIIDDASTDDSNRIIQSFKDERIRLVTHKTNHNLTKTLNEGLNLAVGKYIARMDQDDVSLPTRLAKQVTFLDNNSEVGIVGTDVQIIDQLSKRGAIINFPKTPILIQWSLCFYSPLAHPTVMMHKKLIRDLGGYTSELLGRDAKFGGEDYALWCHASTITRLSNLNEILLYLRKHQTNMSKVYLKKHAKNTAKISQFMLSNALGTTIPINVVDLLVNSPQVSDAHWEASSVIVRLHQSLIAKTVFSQKEHIIVLEDVAIRLLKLAFQSPYYRFKILMIAIETVGVSSVVRVAIAHIFKQIRCRFY